MEEIPKGDTEVNRTTTQDRNNSLKKCDKVIWGYGEYWNLTSRTLKGKELRGTLDHYNTLPKPSE